MINNFLMGGKLGDFLHSLYAVKEISVANKIQANVYMYDIGWELGIENTHAELKPILEQQSYINSLFILDNYSLDPIQNPSQSTPIEIYDQHILENGYIDLGAYIRSPYLFQNCWTELYSKTFDFKITEEYAWLTYNKENPDTVGKVLIHRRYNPARLNNEFPYEHIIEEYKDDIVFIGSSELDYDNFPHKDKVPFYKITTLDKWFSSINSCEVMVSNLTGPTVIAHALDKKRIIELPNTADAAHCIGEEKYSSNIQWYLSENLNTLFNI